MTLRRVLHVTEAPLGGVVAYLEEVLAAQGDSPLEEVTLVTPEINLPALDRAKGTRLRLVPFAHERGSVMGLLRLARLTVREARAIRPEVLHVHSTFAGAMVRLCRPLIPRRTRIVYCPHGWSFLREGKPALNRALALAERVLSLGCDRIICISEHEREEALAAGLPARKLVVIDNGVTPRPAAAPIRREGPLKIAFAGRFDRQKGFDTYCEVMRRLGDAARGIAIGRAIVAADQVSIPPNVEVLGWQPRERVFDLYREADVLLVPSRWEGFGLVAIEAMQAGTAVFASRVGGLQDIVREGETGRLFTPGDAEAIVAAIRSTTREALTAMGQKGTLRFHDRYTAARMNSQILQLYIEMTGRDLPILQERMNIRDCA